MKIENDSILDLTHKLDSNVQIYPGDPSFSSTPWSTIENDGYSVHALSMGSHTGTHIDAPSHFFKDGKTIDQIHLSSLFGPLVVVDLTQRGLRARQKITWADIETFSDRMHSGVILFIYTGWSAFWGSPKYFEHPFLTREAAEKIIEKGVRILGVDTLNPDETPYQGIGGADGFGVHEVVLGAGGIIAENLANLQMLGGRNRVALIPLNIVGSDGSPVRAFAWKG